MVCVWSGTLIGKKHASDFENWFKNEFDIEALLLKPLTNSSQKAKEIINLYVKEVKPYV